MQSVKNKKLTYLLICAVAAVWGIILYKVFFNKSDGDYEMKNKLVKAKDEPYDQYVQKPDTFKLALNYKDPFIGAIEVEPAPKVADPGIDAAMMAMPLPAPPVVDWSFIRYSGYIINPETKNIISILVVNGRERMISEGEKFEGVKLIKNKKDSVLVNWNGKMKHIRQ